MIIEMEGFSVTLVRKRIKNLNLRIQNTGVVEISAPLKMPLKAIYQFLDEKYSWIEKHLYRIQETKREAPQHLITGEYAHVHGVKYELQVHETQTNQRIELQGNHLCLFVKPKSTKVYKEQFLKKWYYTRMQECLTPLLDKWESIMGVTIAQISIKHMKSRWGSCHPVKKQVTLNLRLMEKPLICLEYVIVHELVHFFEPSHNHRFHAFMDEYLPDWKEIKELLNTP